MVILTALHGVTALQTAPGLISVAILNHLVAATELYSGPRLAMTGGGMVNPVAVVRQTASLAGMSLQDAGTDTLILERNATTGPQTEHPSRIVIRLATGNAHLQPVTHVTPTL